MRTALGAALGFALALAGCGNTYAGGGGGAYVAPSDDTYYVDPCAGDACCGDPCCGDACCGDPYCGEDNPDVPVDSDPCGGDPCCGQDCESYALHKTLAKLNQAWKTTFSTRK